MNAYDIPAASPVYSLFLDAIGWLNPIVYTAGLAIAIWAFLCCRRWGYLLVGLYFILVLFSTLVMPSINRAIQERRTPDMSEQTQQKIDVAIQQAIDLVLEEEGHPKTTGKRTIHFPFGPIMLVAGLWLIAKGDIGKKQASQVAATACSQ